MLHLVKSFFHYSRKFGLKFTLKSALSYLGIKVYSTVKYPIFGIKVTVSSNVFWKELERRCWELDCIKYISNVIKEGQILLDVGAWIGPYTLLFSKLVQDVGRVYAFEPDPKALKILQHNVEKKLFN